jgi:phenylacetaldehyde dehydrogenase
MRVEIKPHLASAWARNYLARDHKMLIDGEWVAAASGRRFSTFDPATGEEIATVPEGNKLDIDRAVQAARRAFEGRTWTGIAPTERAKILWKVADLIDARRQEVIELEVLNQGMPVMVANWTIIMAAEVFRYYAGWVTKIHGITADLDSNAHNYHAYTIREPVGVAGLIIPWNGPFLFACFKLSVALAAGCSCVLKPSEETPLTALLLAELLIEAGVPAGVFNVVTGEGHTAGAALTNHPDVDKIGFTGSTEVGKMIVRASADTLKKYTLELGGKSPVIIFEDADIEKTLAGVAQGVFQASGQMCVAGSRVYAHRKVYDQIVAGLSKTAKSLKLGSGFDPSIDLGPLISAKQLRHVGSLIDSASPEGAEIVTGGRRGQDAGYFVEATVMTNTRPDSRIMREEIFGPVVAVTPFDDVDAVTAWANDTHYGLAAAIWTNDLTRAHRMARRLQSGKVWVNCQLASDLSMPSGGYKQSGIGRESGAEGIDAYLQSKSVYIKL